MIDRKTVSRIIRLTAILVAGVVAVATADIANAKSQNGNNKNNVSNNHIREKEAKSDHKGKDAKSAHKDKEKKKKKDMESGRCRKHCKGDQNAKKHDKDPKQQIPVTISYNSSKFADKIGPRDKVVFTGTSKSVIEVKVYSPAGVVLSSRTIATFDSPMTISSSVANSLRLVPSNGKGSNIVAGNNIAVKQNADGSVSFSNVGFN